MKKWSKELNRAFSQEEVQMTFKKNEEILNIPVHKGKENQTMLRFLTPVRMATIKNTNKNKFWRRCGVKGTSIQCRWECKVVQLLWKTVLRLLKKLKIEMLYDPAIPLIRIYTKKCKSGYSNDTCTPMFIAALFTIAKLWKQPRYPTTDEWIKKMW
jgi:hypothetical protein